MLLPLSFLLMAYPLLWVAGVDGFAWMFMLPVGMMVALMRRVVLTPRLVVFAFGSAIFALGALVGALHIEEKLRYLTWFRDTYLIATLICVTWSLANYPRERLQSYVIEPIAAVLCFSSALGITALIYSTTLEFESAAAQVLPRFAVETDFGRRLVYKQVATEGYFAGLPYWRLSGTFDYATSYGAVIAVFCLFVLADWANMVRFRSRWLLVSLLAVLMVNLVYSTARASMLALCVGLFVVVFVSGGGVRRVALSISALILMFIMLPIFGDLLTLRGEGSLVTRQEIYSRTADAILSNPLGHGSQTDTEGLRYPLGSHSTWLALPYKYGVIGCLGLGLVGFSLFKKRVVNGSQVNIRAAALLVSLFTIAIFEELYLDAMAGIIMFSLLGVALARHRSVENPTKTSLQPTVRDVDVG